jgi:hypothetical protein
MNALAAETCGQSRGGKAGPLKVSTRRLLGSAVWKKSSSRRKPVILDQKETSIKGHNEDGCPSMLYPEPPSNLVN